MLHAVHVMYGVCACMYMYVIVCMYVCMYVRMYVRVSMHTYMYTFIHTHNSCM